MKVAAVIPARMKSSRLPGKPLLPICGVPMIIRVLERARACPELGRIIVATDSEEIYRAVAGHGGEVWMTSAGHRTGSDRVAEVAEKLSEEFILNLQGDEPLLSPRTVRSLVRFGRAHPDMVMTTAMVPLEQEADIVNPNIVKVVVAPDGKALYFSRCPIPHCSAEPLQPGTGRPARRAISGYHKHIGIYLFRREFLLKYIRLPSTPLEIAESLEQLRALESGYAIHVVKVAEDSVSVDTPEDLAHVESLIKAQARGRL